MVRINIAPMQLTGGSKMFDVFFKSPLIDRNMPAVVNNVLNRGENFILGKHNYEIPVGGGDNRLGIFQLQHTLAGFLH